MIFNRYRICGRGSGIENATWEYFAGDFGGDAEYAKEWVLERYESWAPWSEYYKLEVELDVKAPRKVLEDELRIRLRLYESTSKALDDLEEMIRALD